MDEAMQQQAPRQPEWQGPPLSQVGAILHFDSALEYEDIELGNKHWQLDGSCVLVGVDRVLALKHTFGKPGKKAIFLPGEGIFLFSNEARGVDYESFRYERTRSPNGKSPGDRLGLIPLGRRARWTRPFSALTADRRPSVEQKIEAAGYGRWLLSAPTADPSGEESLGSTGQQARTFWADGIQRRARIHLGSSENGLHQLDLRWSPAENGYLEVRRNNSGSPLLVGDGADAFRIVGINREIVRGKGATNGKGQATGDEQLASWMGQDRQKWVNTLPDITTPQGSTWAPIWREFEVTRIRGGRRFTFPVPAGASLALATLSATGGLRLQMTISEGPSYDSQLSDLAEVDHASGRFLVRELNLSQEVRTLVIAVAPVRKAPKNADSAEAQLCVRFA